MMKLKNQPLKMAFTLAQAQPKSGGCPDKGRCATIVEHGTQKDEEMLP
jgi:hypothetical protein